MNYLIRGLIKEKKIRFLAADTTKICKDITKLRNTSPVVSVALGRLISVGAMFGMMNKEAKAKVSLRIQGNGKIGLMIVDANTKGEVRGYVQNSLVELPLKSNGLLDVGRAVGQGMLTVVKDFGLKNNFHSEVALQTGEIGDDFSYYFLTSEQTPSVVALGTSLKKDNSIKVSGGFIIQLLPDATEDDFVFVEAVIKKITLVSKMLEESTNLEELMVHLFGELEYVERYPLKYKCGCGKKRFISSISALKKEEIESMINQDHGAEVECHFCGKKYQLSEEDLKKSLSIHK